MSCVLDLVPSLMSVCSTSRASLGAYRSCTAPPACACVLRQASRIARRFFWLRFAPSRASCVTPSFTPLRVRAQPLDYGDYGDPAKMTDSIFDFVSRTSVLG